MPWNVFAPQSTTIRQLGPWVDGKSGAELLAQAGEHRVERDAHDLDGGVRCPAVHEGGVVLVVQRPRLEVLAERVVELRARDLDVAGFPVRIKGRGQVRLPEVPPDGGG